MRLLWLSIVVSFLAAAGPARADSWSLPQKTTYLSAGGTARLVVTPRELTDQLAYYKDKVEGREPAGQRTGETKRTAHAVLERRIGGRWTRLWAAPLLNEVAPASALVSDDGTHVATFDNWGSVGYGDTVVVVYDGGGRPVRALGLAQLVPADYVAALPRSVSSIWWGGTHRFSPDGRFLLVAVVVPDDTDPPGRPRPTVDIQVDLATGSVVPPSGPAWDRALAQARTVSAARITGDAARKAAFEGPLTAPATTGDREWHDYLAEAFFRTDRDWKQHFPDTKILRSPTARDYKPSEKWVREALDGTDRSPVVMLAAPAEPSQLVSVVQNVTRRLHPGKLRGVRIYVAVPPEPARAIAAALGPSGAEVIVLDLTRPIPQRPERLRGETPLDDLMITADDMASPGKAQPERSPPR